MRTPAFFLVFCLLLAPTPASPAQDDGSSLVQPGGTIPPFVVAGLEEYKNKNLEEAVKIWLKGSTSEGMGINRRAEPLRKYVEFYGAFQSYELMSTRVFSARSRVLYLILHFEKRPVFARFEVYRSDLGWILLGEYEFNENPDKILPACQSVN